MPGAFQPEDVIDTEHDQNSNDVYSNKSRDHIQTHITQRALKTQLYARPVKPDELVLLAKDAKKEFTRLAFENLLNRLIRIEVDNGQMVFHIRLARSGDPVHVSRLNGRI